MLLGAALGIRVLGLLMVGYAGLAILMQMAQVREATMRGQSRFFAESVIALIPAFVIGYGIMIAAWPWSALAPLNPLRGLLDFGAFNYQVKTLLAGQVYDMGDVPRWYVPAYLVIKLPIMMLAGAVSALAFVLWRERGDNWRRRLETALVVFIAAFPVVCEVIDRGPAYTGLRHFLFVVPPFAVLAGIGFDWLLGEIIRARAGLPPGRGGRDYRRARLERRPAGDAASLPISLLQPAGRRAGRRRAQLRHRLLGQHHARGGRRAGGLRRDASTPPIPAVITPSRSAASGCRSRRKPTTACNSPRTGARPTSSSRRRT